MERTTPAKHANKRSLAQKLHDRAQIAQSYLRGEAQGSIAKRLRLSQQQVSYDLACIRESWQRSAIRDFDARKAEELAKLDALEAQYWAAWERSCQELTHSTQEQVEDEISMPGGRRGVRIKVPRSRKRAQMRKEQQVGNSAFLFGVERCIEQRCKLLGLYPATDINVHGQVTFADLFTLAQQEESAPDLRLLPAPEDTSSA